jgi:hypothetical protein
MPKDASAPATKQDIRLLMEQMGRHYDQVERRLAGHEEQIKRHFDVTVEHIRHDLEGANKDRIENHEHRLTRLEERTGISPA